jgi:hypothetical protein
VSGFDKRMRRRATIALARASRKEELGAARVPLADAVVVVETEAVRRALLAHAYALGRSSVATESNDA